MFCKQMFCKQRDRVYNIHKHRLLFSLSLSLTSPPASCRLHLVGIATHLLPSTKTLLWTLLLPLELPLELQHPLLRRLSLMHLTQTANPLVDELNAGFLASNMSAPRRDRPPSSRVGADHAAPAQPNANPLIDELNAGFLGSSTPSPPRRRRRQEPAPQAAPPVPAVTPAVQPPAQPPAQPRGPRGNYNVAERGNADPERETTLHPALQHVCRAAHP